MKEYIFAVPNTSQEIISYIRSTPNNNEILMSTRRPTPNHIANTNGTWSIPEPTIESQISEIENIYKTKLNNLKEDITTSIALNNTSLLEEQRSKYNILLGEQKSLIDKLLE